MRQAKLVAGLSLLCLSAGLVSAAPAGDDASARVNLFAGGSINNVNPVARPFDYLTALFGLKSGGGYKSVLKVAPHPETGAPEAYWGVEGDPARKGWARYGFRVPTTKKALAGCRFEIFLDREAELSVQTVSGMRRSFNSAKVVGKTRKFPLPAGRAAIDLLWNDFDVDASDAVGGLVFSGLPPGGRMFFERIDLVYPDAQTARWQRNADQRRLVLHQGVLVDALAARGVDWKNALMPLDPEGIEPLLWIGMRLSAQREQIVYFTALAASAGAPAPELPDFEARRAGLVARGAGGRFDHIKEEAEALQTELDAVIDRLLAEIPKDQRRFPYRNDDKSFHYPDGRMFRMFGPHFFRSMYMPGIQEWRPWDLRYLAGLGFNGIRLQVRWKLLEPERGAFDTEYLGILTGIMREAERYGFGVSVDLHWGYPTWFDKGAPGYEVSKAMTGWLKQDSYHWPEAVVDTWGRIGEAFADHPNIVAFEVPTNETPISSGPDSFHDTPLQMKRWNDFLKNTYQTREALDAAWRAAGDRFGLADDENWDNASIQPLGFQGDADPQEGFVANPRLYDQLRFVAATQTEVTGDIVKALRRSIPGAMGVFQYTFGESRVVYQSISTCVGENVLPGTHYGMGSIEARKAATLSLGGYDSEQQMEKNRSAVERHVALGLGFCPFAFHHLGGGGMLLADNDWHLKPEVAYLPPMADWVRTHVPPRPAGRKIAVILNNRLAATTGRLVGDLPDTLTAEGDDVGVFDSLRIIAEPSLLDGYALAVTESGYLDPRLLDILRRFAGQTLLFGRLDIDAWARAGEAGLSGELARRGLFLKEPAAPRSADALADFINLEGSWDFKAVPTGEDPAAPAVFENWDSMRVPRRWPESGLLGSLRYHYGDGWYRKSVEVPAGWRGRAIRFEAGIIDDIDWAFWNGTLIGHTGTDVPNHWQARRVYTVPAEALRPGEANELVICVRNIRGNGGILKGPVMVTGESRGEMALDGKKVPASCSPSASLVPAGGLVPEAEVLATFSTPEHPDAQVALARQGRVFWYFKDTALNMKEPADRLAIDAVLSRLE